MVLKHRDTFTFTFTCCYGYELHDSGLIPNRAFKLFSLPHSGWLWVLPLSPVESNIGDEGSKLLCLEYINGNVYNRMSFVA
jgi:hypothetical protein